MYSIMSVVNTTVLFIWKFLRKWILKIVVTRKKVYNCVWQQMLTRLIRAYFAICTNIESLSYASETNRLCSYINYTWIFKNSIFQSIIWNSKCICFPKTVHPMVCFPVKPRDTMFKTKQENTNRSKLCFS